MEIEVKKDAFGGDVAKPESKEKSVEKPENVERKLTPTEQIAELSRKLGEYQARETAWGETSKSKDDNIRAMKTKIKTLESQIKGEGEAEKEEILFKDIKSSKDLTQDQKDEMTDAEMKAMDEIATLKQGINQLAGIVKNIKKGQEKGGEIDINGIVQKTAKDLANGNTELANFIIENVKEFRLDGLSEEDIVAKVGKAAQLVPNYKPPKEQISGGKGKAAGNGEDSDPYGVDKIVEEVHARKETAGFDL